MINLHYTLISKYRRELMGIAIISVFVFHARNGLDLNNVLFFIVQTGYSGVDIFLFLSGIGLFFSLSKNENLGEFYLNRLVRIMPTYWLIIGVFSFYQFLINKISFIGILLRMTTLSFWLNEYSYEWYIPSLLVLYILFPFYFKSLIKSRSHSYMWVIMLAPIFFGIFISVLCILLKLNYLIIFTSRIPVFFIGSIFGYFIKSNFQIKPNHLYLYFFGFLIGVLILALSFLNFSYSERLLYGFDWYPFILIIPFLCLILAKIISYDVFERSQFNVFLRFCGDYSLCIYLIHGMVFILSRYINKYLYIFESPKFVQYFIYFLITLLLSFCMQQIIEYFTKKSTRLLLFNK
jgi:peptidoglycan/LPS O-acetylase OafA/YrhL